MAWLLHICLTQCNTSHSHRVDQVVDCGLWNVGPLLFNGCVKLLDIGRDWTTLSYTPIQSIPNMLNGWYVRWVCWPCKNWDVFSFQELCTDPCNMGPCIIMLHLCLLSITYACPYHNPTATMGHSIHNVDQPLQSAKCYRMWAFAHSSRLRRRTAVRSRPRWGQRACRWDSFPETVSDSLCRNSLVMQTDCCSSCPGGWSQTILEVKMLDV